MEPILGEFEAIARTLSFSAPRIPLVANLTGEPWQAGQVPDAGYWRRHLREPVQFAAGISALHRVGCTVFVEVGPAPVLAAAGSRCLPDDGALWAASLRAGADDWQTMLKSLGALYESGVTPDWRGLERDYQRRHVDLPTYPFQHERYWYSDSSTRRPYTPATSRLHPLIDRQLRSSAISSFVFESELSLEQPLLDGHRVFDTPIFPAAAYVELALAAAELAYGSGVQLAELLVHQALVLPDGEKATLQVILGGEGAPADHFTILSQRASDEPWRMHASGRLLREAATPAAVPTLGEAQAACREELVPGALYHTLEQMGMDYGPAFRGLERVWRGSGSALGLFVGPMSCRAKRKRMASTPRCSTPASRWLQLCYPPMASYCTCRSASRAFVAMHQPAPRYGVTCSAERRPTGRNYRVPVRPVHDSGLLVAEADRVVFKQATRVALMPSVEPADWLYEVAWRPQPLNTAAPNEPGRWLIIDAGSGLGDHLAGAFADSGVQSVLTTPGAVLTELAPGRWQADPAQPTHFRRCWRPWPATMSFCVERCFLALTPLRMPRWPTSGGSSVARCTWLRHWPSAVRHASGW